MSAPEENKRNKSESGNIKHTKVLASEEEMKASRGRSMHGVQKLMEECRGI